MIEVYIKDNYLYIKSNYNKALLKSIHNIHWSERTFLRPEKIWQIRITSKNKRNIYKLLSDIDNNFKTNFIKEIVLPVVSFGKAVFENNKLCIRCEYDTSFISDIHKVNGKWNKAQKEWIIEKEDLIKYEKKIKQLLEDYKIEYIGEIELDSILKNIKEELEKERIENERIKQQKIKESYAIDSNMDIKVPEGLELYPFQKAGVEFISKHNNVFLFDDMGLGKTIQVLAYLYNDKNLRPVLIICPAIVKEKWKNEIEKWCPGESTEIIYGRNNKNNYTLNSNFIIINYDIVKDWVERLKKIDFKVLVLDESHKIKERKSQRTKAILNNLKYINKKILLTGTPILNRPNELWTSILLCNIYHPNFKNFITYAKRYCAAKQTKWGWDVNGASNIEELQQTLRELCMIRRTKDQVLTELPDKIKNFIPININLEEYNKILYKFKEWYSETTKKEQKISKVNVLAQMEKIRQLVNDLKYYYILQYIKDIKKEYSNERIVVFGHHRALLERLKNDLSDYKVDIITGEINQNRRNEIINKAPEILICSTLAIGIGIDLIEYSHAVFTELDWTPANLIQAEDRLYRIGQKKTVIIDYLIAKDTFEEYMKEILEMKEEIIKNFTDQSILEYITNKLFLKKKQEEIK